MYIPWLSSLRLGRLGFLLLQAALLIPAAVLFPAPMLLLAVLRFSAEVLLPALLLLPATLRCELITCLLVLISGGGMRVAANPWFLPAEVIGVGDPSEEDSWMILPLHDFSEACDGEGISLWSSLFLPLCEGGGESFVSPMVDSATNPGSACLVGAARPPWNKFPQVSVHLAVMCSVGGGGSVGLLRLGSEAPRRDSDGVELGLFFFFDSSLFFPFLLLLVLRVQVAGQEKARGKTVSKGPTADGRLRRMCCSFPLFAPSFRIVGGGLRLVCVVW